MKAVVFELPHPQDLEEGQLERCLRALHGELAHLPHENCRQVTSYRGRPGLLLQLPKEELAAACTSVREILRAMRIEFVEHLYYDLPQTMPVESIETQAPASDPGAPKRRKKALRRHLEAGRAFCRMELFGDARASFQAAHELEPRCAEALYGLGVVEAKEGRDDTAELLVRRAISLDNGRAVYHYTLGGLCHRDGRLEEAEQHLKRAVGLDPQDPVYFDFLGWIYLDQGELDRASSAFQEALERAPGLPSALSGMGSVLFAEGNLEESVSLLEQAVEDTPDYLVARLQLGWCRFHVGDDRAEEDFLQVLHGDVEELREPAAFGLGRLYLRRGTLNLAIEYLERSAGEDWPSAHWLLGEAFFLSGRFEEAEKELLRALELDPELRDEVETRLALCAMRRGRMDQAEVWIRRALDHQGLQAPLLELLGAIQGSRLEWEDARRSLQQACGLEPDNVPARFQLGWIHENLDELDAARDCYLRALRLDPGCLEAAVHLGWLFLDEDRLGEAAVVFESALERYPEEGELMSGLGRVLYREGRFDRAADLLHRALLRLPERPDTRAWLGAALCSVGRVDEGRRELRQALSEGPDEETASFIRRQVRRRAPRVSTLAEGLAARTRKKGDRLRSVS